MTDHDIYDVCKKAVKFYGITHQLAKYKEEENELIVAIGDHDPVSQIQEIADVALMHMQIQEIDDTEAAIDLVLSTYYPNAPDHFSKKVIKGHMIFKAARLSGYMKDNKGWIPGFKKEN